MNWHVMLAIAGALAGPLMLLQVFMKKPASKAVVTSYEQWLEDERADWPRRMFWRGVNGFLVVMVIGLPLAIGWILVFGP